MGNDVYRAVVDYAFGSGDRGLTLVGRDESGTARELRLSRYGEIDRWSETTGQALRPGRPADFLGRPLSPDDLRGCFECHTTQPDAAQLRTGPEPAVRGIGCEQCHGPGGHHLAAVEARLDDLAIARRTTGKQARSSRSAPAATARAGSKSSGTTRPRLASRPPPSHGAAAIPRAPAFSTV